MGTWLWLPYVQQVLTKFWTHAAAEGSDADANVSVCAFFFCSCRSCPPCVCVCAWVVHSCNSAVLRYSSALAATATALSFIAAIQRRDDGDSDVGIIVSASVAVRFASVLVRLFGFRSHSGSNARLAWLVFYLTDADTYVCECVCVCVCCPLDCCFSIM